MSHILQNWPGLIISVHMPIFVFLSSPFSNHYILFKNLTLQAVEILRDVRHLTVFKAVNRSRWVRSVCGFHRQPGIRLLVDGDGQPEAWGHAHFSPCCHLVRWWIRPLAPPPAGGGLAFNSFRHLCWNVGMAACSPQVQTTGGSPRGEALS